MTGDGGRGQRAEENAQLPITNFQFAIFNNCATTRGANPPYSAGVNGASLTRVGEAAIGGWAQTAIFSADSKTLLVTNSVEHAVQVLRWDGRTLTDPQIAIKLKGAPVLMGTAAR